MKTVGTVIEVNGTSALVQVERQSACDGCHTKEFCLACNQKKMTVSARNSVDAKLGDTVELESSSGTVLGYAAAVFVVPIIAAIVAYVLGDRFCAGTAAPYLAALITFVSVFAVICLCLNAKARRERNLIIITKIIN